jgi:hypothetical protein
MSATSDRWAERLARYPHAGQTITDFCADEGVSVSSFYAWKRKLTPPSSSQTLVPITLTPTLATANLELLLPSGLCLRLPTDYPPTQLAVLLRHLEEPSC